MNTVAEAIADTKTRDLALAAGVSTQAVQAWKRGDSLPDPGLVPKIATKIGWPSAKLAELLVKDAAARRNGSK